MGGNQRCSLETWFPWRPSWHWLVAVSLLPIYNTDEPTSAANVGLIGAFGYNLYSKPHLRTDTRVLSTAAISALVLFGAEGYVAEAYRRTDAGQEEERRARDEGDLIYRRTKAIVLRPGVLGGLVGVCELERDRFS